MNIAMYGQIFLFFVLGQEYCVYIHRVKFLHYFLNEKQDNVEEKDGNNG